MLISRSSGLPATCSRTRWNAAGRMTFSLRGAEAEALEEAHQLGKRVLVGRLVDAVGQRHVQGGEIVRDGLVGGEHEALDQAVGDVALGLDDVLRAAAQVEDDLGLGQVEVDRAALAPDARQELGERRHALEIVDQVDVAPADREVAVDDDLAHLGVGESRAARDDAGKERGAEERAAAVEVEEHRLHETVDAGVEAADVVRELLGQHRYDAVGEVDARAARPRLDVESAAARHVGGDVGDRDQQAGAAGGAVEHRDGVVEVARVLAVDRDQRERAQIDAGGERDRLVPGAAGMRRLGKTGAGRTAADGRCSCRRRSASRFGCPGAAHGLGQHRGRVDRTGTRAASRRTASGNSRGRSCL